MRANVKHYRSKQRPVHIKHTQNIQRKEKNHINFLTLIIANITKEIVFFWILFETVKEFGPRYTFSD